MVWCPDWPVVAAGIIDGVPRVRARWRSCTPTGCSPARRRPGPRASGAACASARRRAGARSWSCVEHDPGRGRAGVRAGGRRGRGARARASRWSGRGSCALAARGPARYFGGEEAAAERLVEQIAQACAVEAQVGIADGVFAARCSRARAGSSCRRAAPPASWPGSTSPTLGPARPGRPAAPARGPHPGRLRRAARRRRAGPVRVRRGATRTGSRPARRPAARAAPAAARPGRHRASSTQPLDRVDTAAFAARALAERLHERLAGARAGLPPGSASRPGPSTARSCTGCGATTGCSTAAAIADRVRWQLDGWLTDSPRGPDPDADGPPRASSGCGWSRTGWSARRPAARAVGRGRARPATRPPGPDPGAGLLGPDAVVTAVLGGGRGSADQVRLVPWGDERAAPPRPRRSSPWPGRLPPPAPATVLAPAAAGDRASTPTGAPVGGHRPARGHAATPARLVAGSGGGRRDRSSRRLGRAVAGRRALVGAGRGDPAGPVPAALADGRALLVVLRQRRWSVEAIYD